MLNRNEITIPLGQRTTGWETCEKCRKTVHRTDMYHHMLMCPTPEMLTIRLGV